MSKRSTALTVHVEVSPPASIPDAMLLLDRVKAARGTLDLAEKAAEDYLAARIQPGETVQGVTMREYSRSSPPYKEILGEAKNRLIPKTRWPELEALVETMTTRKTWYKPVREKALPE